MDINQVFQELALWSCNSMYNLQKTGIYTGLFNFLMHTLLLSLPSKQKKSVRGEREREHISL
jgi:hypothetical protein